MSIQDEQLVKDTHYAQVVGQLVQTLAKLNILSGQLTTQVFNSKEPELARQLRQVVDELTQVAQGAVQPTHCCLIASM